MGLVSSRVFRPIFHDIKAHMEADTGLRTYFETCAGIDPKHLQPVFDQFDAENTGYLDKSHFEALVKACLHAQRVVVPQLVHNVVGINQEVFHHGEHNFRQDVEYRRELHNKFDEQYESILDRLIEISPQLVPEIFKKIDVNHDRKVTREEFTATFLDAMQHAFFKFVDRVMPSEAETIVAVRAESEVDAMP